MAGFAVPAFNFVYQGLPASSGTLNVYQTGTTTPVTIYSDGGLTTPLSNPLTLDANGQAKFYVSGAVNLRFDAYSSTGVLIESIDPVYTTGAAQTVSAGFFTTEAALSSATTTDLGSVTTTNIINITGTTTITSFGSSANTNNPLYFIRFSGALTLTYNATSLILPGQANITTVAGDCAIAKYEGTGNWRITEYTKASMGYPIYTVSTTELDKVNDTVLANVVGLTANLVAGKTYNIIGHLTGTAGAAGGGKFQLTATNGLTASSSSVTVTNYNGTTINAKSTQTIGNAYGATATFTDIDIEGVIVVNAGGTLTIQFAQNVSNGTASSVFINSYLNFISIN